MLLACWGELRSKNLKAKVKLAVFIGGLFLLSGLFILCYNNIDIEYLINNSCLKK